jgi:hypothetical protein
MSDTGSTEQSALLVMHTTRVSRPGGITSVPTGADVMTRDNDYAFAPRFCDLLPTFSLLGFSKNKKMYRLILSSV